MARKVLVVEDNPVLQKVVRIICAQLGIAVDVVTSCCAAVQAISNESRYKMVFLDNRLPDRTGCECVKDIRKLEERTGKHLPIIAMTGEVEEKLFYVRQGMDDYLQKPFTMQEFSDMVQRWGAPKGPMTGSGDERGAPL